jgi:hypothetical protein
MAQRNRVPSEHGDTELDIGRIGNDAWVVEAHYTRPTEPPLKFIFRGSRARDDAFAFYLECGPRQVSDEASLRIDQPGKSPQPQFWRQPRLPYSR